MNEGFFTAYLERLENLRAGFAREIADLPAPAMDWRPGPETNSLAVLLTHTAGAMRYWIGDVALAEPIGRVREREFIAGGQSGAELLGRLEAVIAYARDGLARLSLDDLGSQRTRAQGEAVTCGWALLHALEHSYLHLGHAQLTNQLRRQAGQ